MLVNGLEARVETSAGRFALSSQRYVPDVVHPDGAARIERFAWERRPAWTFRLEDGTAVEHALFAAQGKPVTVLTWRLIHRCEPAVLVVRPLLSGRDYHALHHENPALRFDARAIGQTVHWQPYDGVPGIAALSNGRYDHAPLWYRNFRSWANSVLELAHDPISSTTKSERGGWISRKISRRPVNSGGTCRRAKRCRS